MVNSVVADWDVPKIRFDVDGTPVCAWLRQGGRWQVKTRQRIAWDASVLLLSSTDGRYVEEFDLIDVGLGEDVLVFALSGSGRMLGAREWLDPQREYAIAYDDSLNLAGIDPAVGAPWRGGGRKVARLSKGWTGTPRLEIDGLVYWDAHVKECRTPETLDLTVSNENGASREATRLGESRRLRIRGVPEDALAVELLGFGGAISAASSGDGWVSNGSVKLDARLLLGTTRLRVRVRTPSRDRCWKPKTEWNVLGLAALEQDEDGKRPAQWTMVDPKKVLNRAGGGPIVRAFVPRDWAKPRILEGHRLVVDSGILNWPTSAA